MNHIKNQRGALSVERFIIIIILIFVAFMSLVAFAPRDNYDLVEVGTTDLVALQDNVSTNGDFFLGSGNIDSEIYYYYMYEGENGGLNQNKIPGEDSTVFYIESGKQPQIKKFLVKHKGFLGSVLNVLSNKSYKYEMYVEKGSITEEVKINLE